MIVLGHRNHDELNVIYSMSDVVVVPSRIEGFNLTAIEGWIHRKPCVVSDGAGVSELIHDEVNGYTFASGNDESLSEKLELLLNSPEASQKMGENGFMMSKQCYVDSAVKQLQQVFEETSAVYSSGTAGGKN
ncbi:MAG: glycosyltransferase family 4 protein [Nitrososphaerota archaeon]|nr:glycosyltransferase family 4 protein [Nitrososphaerota archaeon]